MKIQFKKLAPDAQMPTRGSEHAAGYDLYASLPIDKLQSSGLNFEEAHSGEGYDVWLKPGHRAIVPTGLAVAIPEGYEMQIRPRSGLAHNHGLMVTNAPGTVDADYRGEVCVLLVNVGQRVVYINAGERIAQAVFARHETPEFEEVEELPETARGEGGFGSTGL